MLAPGTTAFTFPGQGSQFVGMGCELADNSPAAQRVFDAADQLLGVSLSSLCWDGPAAELNDTLNTQAAVYTCSLAALAALRAAIGEFTPAFAAGHSLGEITALAAVGSLSFESGLKLVRERGRLMKLAGERQPGGMAAIIRLEVEQLIDICAQVREESGLQVQVANDNCPGQLVISGHVPALDKVMKHAVAAGARRSQRLPISIAAHSSLMESITAQYRKSVHSLVFSPPELPIIANTTAQPMLTPDSIRAELTAQLTSTVRWRESVLRLVAEGITDFVELGPKNVLTGLLRRIDREAKGHALCTPEAIDALASS